MGKALHKKPFGLSPIEGGIEEDPDYPELDSMTILGDPVEIIVQCWSYYSVALATTETIAIPEAPRASSRRWGSRRPLRRSRCTLLQ